MTLRRSSITLTLLLLIGLVLVSTAMADPLLDFVVPVTQTGAHIDYSTSGGPLTGTKIHVSELVALGTPQNSGTYQCIGCFLNFVTGNYTGGGNTSWNFGGGPNSSITISGCVDVDNDGGSCDSHDIQSSKLLSGSFGNATVLPFGNTFKIAGSQFMDMKDANLAAFFGLQSQGWTGNFNLSFDANGTPPHTFKSTQVIGGDVFNTLVPEPGSCFLLLSALAGAGALRRRKACV